MNEQAARPIDILMIEDDRDDVFLTEKALKSGKVLNVLHVVTDGEEAMAYLRRRGPYAGAVRPDLIVLDLNLPKMNGQEVLTEIKGDPDLRVIPVVILTTSDSEQDVLKSYRLHANCYIHKPVDLDQFIKVVHSIEEFWFSIVRLPSPAGFPADLATGPQD